MTITIELDDLTKLEIISKLKSITSLDLIFKTPVSLTNDNFYFIKEMENLRSLSINASYIEPEFFKDMNNLEELKLCSCYNMNYHSLEFLNSLRFDDGPYTIIKYLSKEDLIRLKESNVKVSSNSYNELDFFNKIIYINDKIDGIIEDMNLSNEVSDNKRVKKIISYILDDYKNDYIEEEKYEELLKKEGKLYFSIESDYKTSSSYIDLMEVILKKLNINHIDYRDIFEIRLIKEMFPQSFKRYKIKIDNRIWIVSDEIIEKILKVFSKNKKEDKKIRRIYELNNR